MAMKSQDKKYLHYELNFKCTLCLQTCPSWKDLQCLMGWNLIIREESEKGLILSIWMLSAVPLYNYILYIKVFFDAFPSWKTLNAHFCSFSYCAWFCMSLPLLFDLSFRILSEHYFASHFSCLRAEVIQLELIQLQSLSLYLSTTDDISM